MNAANATIMRDLLDRALELPAQDRQAYLNEACAGSEELRAEIDELLSAFGQANSFLEDAPASARALLSELPTSSSLIGRQLGRYTIQRLIAAGGMGAVYEAVQHQPRRVVALKIMKHGIASRSALRRFEYESHILGRLRHPGIAQVYEAAVYHNEAGANVPYFVMEYVPNAMTLTDYARTNDLTTRRRLELFTQICDAVHHGHQKGIIHRDLKPANILVDSTGQPKIIDFGIARATDSDLAVTTIQTGIGQLIGTLQYMSPEQCAGDAIDLDIRSDVYALGVVLYELLAGRMPYDLARVPIAEATRVIREQPPARPSDIDGTLRGDVETIALKCLEKDRERRYGSAAELADDIRRYLNHEPIMARPATFMYHFRMFARRNRAVVRSLAALFITLVAAIVIVSVLWARAERSTREKADLAERAISLFNQHLAVTVQLSDEAGQPEMAQRLIESAEATLKATFGNEPHVQAGMLITLAQANSVMRENERAKEYLAHAMQISHESLGELHPQTLRCQAILASLHRATADYDKAEELYRTLVKAEQRLPPAESTGQCWHEYADMLHDIGRCSEAEDMYRQTIERRAHGQPPGSLGHSIDYLTVQLAGVFRDQGRFKEAEAAYKNVIDQMKHEGRSESDTILCRAQRELARLYVLTADFDQARFHLRAALDGFNDFSEANGSNPDLLHTTELGALIDLEQGRPAQALDVLHSISLRAQASFTAENEWWAAQFQTSQAICLIALQRFDEAEQLLRSAHPVLLSRLGHQHHRTQRCLRALLEVAKITRSRQSADYGAPPLSDRCLH